MFRVTSEGDPLAAIIQNVERLSRPNLAPLAEIVRDVMIDDNREGLLAGTDGRGVAMAPVLDSTIRRGRGGDGPPIVPRQGASRAITAYVVETSVIPGGVRLLGSWPGAPFMGYQATGTRHMPQRDPAAIRPEGEARIVQATDEFLDDLVNGE